MLDIDQRTRLQALKTKPIMDRQGYLGERTMPLRISGTSGVNHLSQFEQSRTKSNEVNGTRLSGGPPLWPYSAARQVAQERY
jgi:hypothetical protein